tara:strand:+ start:109 stop:282 length:174 start_codon:yes stop_codon:yes gene_type:complete
MGKMKSKWLEKEALDFEESLNDYLYFMYTKDKQKEKSSERAKIRKISTRRRVDVKNK